MSDDPKKKKKGKRAASDRTRVRAREDRRSVSERLRAPSAASLLGAEPRPRAELPDPSLLNAAPYTPPSDRTTSRPRAQAEALRRPAPRSTVGGDSRQRRESNDRVNAANDRARVTDRLTTAARTVDAAATMIPVAGDFYSAGLAGREALRGNLDQAAAEAVGILPGLAGVGLAARSARGVRGSGAVPMLMSMSGTGAGAAAGAIMDDENRMRGALVGGAAAGGLGFAAGRAAEKIGARRAGAGRAGAGPRLSLLSNERGALGDAALRDPVTGRVFSGKTYEDALKTVPEDRITYDRVNDERMLGTENMGTLDEQDRFVPGGLLGRFLGNERGMLGAGENPDMHRLREAPAGSTLIADLAKADAIEEVKRLKAAGIRAEMRADKDGTFRIVRRGEAQAQPSKEVAPTRKLGHSDDPVAMQGTEPTPAGFFSRMGNRVTGGDWPEEMTADEWYKALRNDPDISKDEVDFVFGRNGKPPEPLPEARDMDIVDLMRTIGMTPNPALARHVSDGPRPLSEWVEILPQTADAMGLEDEGAIMHETLTDAMNEYLPFEDRRITGEQLTRMFRSSRTDIPLYYKDLEDTLSQAGMLDARMTWPQWQQRLASRDLPGWFTQHALQSMDTIKSAYNPGQSRHPPIDGSKVITRDQMREIIDMRSPVYNLGVETGSIEGRPITSEMIDEEARYLHEADYDYYRDEIGNAVRQRDEHVDSVHSMLTSVYGREAADRMIAPLRDDVLAGDTDQIFGRERDFFDPWREQDGEEGVTAAIEEWMENLRASRGDPQQVALFGERDFPHISDADLMLIERELDMAKSYHTDAVMRSDAYDDPDWDEYNRQAEENLNEHFENGDLNIAQGDVKYAQYQRDNPQSSAYFETQIRNPGSGARASHFNDPDGLQAHNRGEYDDDYNAYTMIESQSDAGARVRYQNDPRNPFYSTPRWTLLNTGQALRNAAQVDARRFRWPTAENAHERASLSEEAGEHTYERGTPKALDLIFRSHGFEPPQAKTVPDNAGHGKMFEIPLSPDFLDAIRKYGVPGMALGGLAAKQAMQQPGLLGPREQQERTQGRGINLLRF